jgi:hypothetical protein
VAVSPRLAPPRRARTAGSARGASAALAALFAALALLGIAAPAGAVVTSVEGGPSVGVVPREAAFYTEGTVKWAGLEKGKGAQANEVVKTFTNAGNPVLHAANTYVVYWDPQDYYHGDWQGLIDGFMANMGAVSGSLATVFAVDTQYTDATNKPAASGSVFHGAYTDTNPYPASGCTDPHPFVTGMPLVEGKSVCVTDAQVRAQLSEFITQHALPKGMGTVYYLLTPPGVAVCLDTGGAKAGHCSDFAGGFKELEEAEAERRKDEEEKEPFVESEEYKSYKRSFCSYHGVIGEGGAETILYAMVPWTAGGAGDPHLAAADQTSDYPCQDGGFEPFRKPGGELQELERPKPKTPLEEEEFAKKNEKEKREAEEAEELGLNNQHIQEPNSLGEAFGSDGGHDAGLADLIINQIAVEQQNIVTDPLMNAWQDASGNELMDECRNSFFIKRGGSANATPDTLAGTLYNQVFGRNYYLNDTFNMAALRLPYPAIPCLNGVNLIPSFTSPNTVNANEIVGFDGMESDVELNSTISYPAKTTTYATFTWNFGDGSPEVSGFAPGASSENSPSSAPCAAPWLAPCAGSTFHAYTYGGTYQVTLTVKDTGGHVASVSEPITVVGPAPPSPSAPGSGSGQVGGSSSGSGAGSGSGSGGGSAGIHHTPAATAAIVSHSLRLALRRGLAVRYSVNEALVGHVEVMIPTSVARRMRVGGAGAVGLPAGTPPQTIVAKSILVSSRGGTSTLTLHVSARVAARLRRLHSADFLLRLVLHNTSGGNVVVLASATLSH